MFKLRRIILINISILFACLALMEGVAALVLVIHETQVADRVAALDEDAKRKAKNETDSSQQKTQYDRPLYSDPSIKEDLDTWQARAGSPFDYANFLVYRNRPYTSRFVNVDDSGVRANGSEKWHPAETRYEIWMLGSSSVFGVSTGDAQSVPAWLERKLRDRHPGKHIIVRNLGVVAYTSLQDYLNFKLRLLKKKPDMVIIFNGVNDYYYSWYPLEPLADTMFQTGVNSDVLHDYWDWHADRRWINWHFVVAGISSLFSNTIDLIGKAQKWLLLRSANADIQLWKENYRKRRDETAKKVVPTIAAGYRFYIENIEAITALAARHKIAVVAVQQPLMFATRKQLIAQEVTETAHLRLSHFSMTENELEALTEVPSYRLDQTQYWKWQSFVDGYEKQKAQLATFAASAGIEYIDIMPAINAAGQVPVFSSPIHYTYRGAELIAGAMVPGVERASGARLE